MLILTQLMCGRPKKIKDIYILMEATEKCDGKQIDIKRQIEQYMENRMQ
jgi:hypothetical protein